MEATQKAIGDDSDMGKNLSQKEKQSIHKSIDEVEENTWVKDYNRQKLILIWVIF